MAKKVSKTLVIPTYTVNKDLETMALKCIETHRGQVDKIIVSEDGGMYSDKLQKAADIYVYDNINVGFTKNVNHGWALSYADFTIIANSDTFLVEGNIDTLCRKGYVTSPKIVNLPNYPGFCGSYWVVPKEIKEKYGILNERFKTYQSDMEYYERIKHIFCKVNEVKIYHHKAQTIKARGLDVAGESNLDNNTYDEIKSENNQTCG